MKNDHEVKLYMSERRKGSSQRVAAARAGMSERTARKYEQAGKLPSELKRPHTWSTRDNPFEEDWPWVVEQLERDSALQASTLFALLCEKHPGRYRPTQDRTLRRHIARWRALHGPDQEDWTVRYQGLMTHYGMQPTWNNTGVAHENGDVEQSHHRFKQAVDQALRVRGSRDFPTRAAYDHFVQDLIHKRNQTRVARFTAEKAALRPLPVTALSPCKELRVIVSRFSTIAVAGNVYSVPSRLIGTSVLIRVHSEVLEGYVGTTRVFELPRLIGKHHHQIDYHHIIWSLVRKPGAFAAYRYRDELFPTTTFRLAYDRLRTDGAKRADRDYVRILHLAASTSEAEVETALQIVLEAGKSPTFATVRDLVQVPTMRQIPAIEVPPLDLSAYDQLIPSRRNCV